MDTLDRETGGYFGPERWLRPEGNAVSAADGAVALCSGRHALEYILSTVSPRPSRVLLPYYTCASVLEPLQRLGLEVARFHISRDMMPVLDAVGEGEMAVINNYFGLLDRRVRDFAHKFPGKTIIDNTQAFFALPSPGTLCFNSARKFVGVTDGAFAYGVHDPGTPLPATCLSSSAGMYMHMRERFGASAGYDAFLSHERSFSRMPMCGMSCRSTSILRRLDRDGIIRRRRENFKILHGLLGPYNSFDIPADGWLCPMVYPFYHIKSDLHAALISGRIYVARYWEDVVSQPGADAFERDLATFLVPLPVDQRYDAADMRRVADIVLSRISG